MAEFILALDYAQQVNGVVDRLEELLVCHAAIYAAIEINLVIGMAA
jgi:hypothetical protein